MDPGINLEMLIVDRHLTIHRHSFGKTDLADGNLLGFRGPPGLMKAVLDTVNHRVARFLWVPSDRVLLRRVRV